MPNTPETALRIVIQSRLSSSRLPAKAPGLPSVILCAKRARNTDIDTLLATSGDPNDDPLAELEKEEKGPGSIYLIYLIYSEGQFDLSFFPV